MASRTNPKADAKANTRADVASLRGRSYRRGLSLGLGLSELLVLLLFLVLLLSVPYATTRPAATVAPGGALGADTRARPATGQEAESVALLIESRRELGRVQAENVVLRESLSRDKGELLAQLKQQTLAIAHLAKEKGLDASCWYDFDEAGKQNQVYLFDVNVYDVGVEIKDRKAPAQYTEEKAILPLDLPYGERISDQDFLRVTKPVYEYARTRKLRPYPCVFYVRIRDRTSAAATATAAERYKQADESVVGQHFYRYRSRTP